MKKYLLGFTAIVLAIGFSAFTNSSKSFTDRTFKLKLSVDKTSASAIQDVTNWDFAGFSCGSGTDIPCTITVPDAYTHTDGNGDRFLNTSTSQGSVISIETENGLFVAPSTQYIRVAPDAQTVYAKVNKTL